MWQTQEFIKRWLFSTNHKDIENLYLLFGTFAGVIYLIYLPILLLRVQQIADRTIRILIFLQWLPKFLSIAARTVWRRFLFRIQTEMHVTKMCLLLGLVTFTVPVFLKKGFFKDDTYFALLFGANQLYWIFIVAVGCLLITGFYKLGLYDTREHSIWTQRFVLFSKILAQGIAAKIFGYYTAVVYVSTLTEVHCEAPEISKVEIFVAAGALGGAVGYAAMYLVHKYQMQQKDEMTAQVIKKEIARINEKRETQLSEMEKTMESRVERLKKEAADEYAKLATESTDAVRKLKQVINERDLKIADQEKSVEEIPGMLRKLRHELQQRDTEIADLEKLVTAANRKTDAAQKVWEAGKARIQEQKQIIQKADSRIADLEQQIQVANTRISTLEQLLLNSTSTSLPALPGTPIVGPSSQDRIIKGIIDMLQLPPGS